MTSITEVRQRSGGDFVQLTCGRGQELTNLTEVRQRSGGD